MPLSIIKKQRSKARLTLDKHTLIVARSNKNITAQIIDPLTRQTIFTASSNKINSGNKSQKAENVGKLVADFLKSKNIETVVFDRNGYVYHGRVMAVAEAVRSQNINI